MGLGWIRVLRARRAALHQEAEALIAAHGADSRSIARASAFAHRTGTPEFERGWAISRVIEHKMKIDRMPDTATRYLEGRS